MHRFNLPEAVEFVLERLNGRGYEAYVVGGCVRDHLMGRVPSDYDVTTNARPDEMKEVFSDCRLVETGLKHGTLTVVLNQMNIEVTTYRVDGAYDDGRHPRDVTFTASLEEDLCRRDFTVNAIAYSPRDGFVDPFSGIDDIGRQRIACVGKPEQRFSEDALRILRAIRFSAVLGFFVDKSTADAVKNMYSTLSLISRERIYQEITKLFLGKWAKSVMETFPEVIAFSLDETAQLVSAETIFRAAQIIDLVPTIPEMRYAALFLHTGETNIAKQVYASLKPSAKSAQAILALLENRFTDTTAPYELKKLMGRYGEDFPPRLIHLRFAAGALSKDDLSAQLSAYEQLRETNPCVTVSALAVNGKDAASLGLKGAEIGKALNQILQKIMKNELPNDRAVLLDYLQRNAR